jgi:short-subunit dehydrogenase
MKAQRILIVGATSAIACACARRWAMSGTQFFLVGRDPVKLAQVGADLGARGTQVHTYVLDLTHYAQHAAMLDACCEALGPIDMALLAHGVLGDQQACEQDAALAVQAFHSNGLSVIALLTALAPRMQAQGSGCIAVISSVAGERGRASNFHYGAAKAAVTAYCSGLRVRLARSGVHLLTILPGFVDTPMTQGLPLPRLLLATPEQVAADITRALQRQRNTLYTPWFWRPIMGVIRRIPERVFMRMKL